MNNTKLALAVKDLLPELSIEELEEGCFKFIEDLEEDADLEGVAFLFPYIIEEKLSRYEKEY